MPLKQKLLVVVSVAFLAALFSTVVFYRWVSEKLVKGGPPGFQGSVVVAARDLPRGTQLKIDDLEMAPWSADKAPGDAFTAEEALEGRFVARALRRGQPVTAASLALGKQDGMAALIPQGMRAVSVHVSEYAGVTQLLQTEDRVDILLADGPRSPGNSGLRLRTILQNVEVLATGREAAGGGTATSTPVVTVLVDAKDSEALSLADQAGSIRLVLRNPLDNTIAETSGQALSDLLAPRRAKAGSGG